MEIIYVDSPDAGKLSQFLFDMDVGYLPIGLDTETSGLDVFTVTPYLLQLNIDGFIYVFNMQNLGKEIITAIVKRIIKSNRKVIVHNAKYDIRILKVCTGLTITNVHDTMWTETMLNMGRGTVFYSLAYLVEKYCGETLDKEIRKEFYTNFNGNVTQEQLLYSAKDVLYLPEIYNKQMEQVKEDKLDRVYDLESRLVPVLATMEHNGIKMDVPKWTKLAEDNLVLLNAAREKLESSLLDKIDYSKYQDALEAFDDLRITDFAKTKRDRNTLAQIYETNEIKLIVRKYFNFGSHAQMLRIINLLGCPVTDTNRKTLDSVKNKFEFISNILEFREWEKSESTYGLNFLSYIHPVTGRVHTEYLNLGAATGRLSSGNSKQDLPNLQNIPKESERRACFISEDGYSLLSYDYSQQEYRLVGAVSKEPAIIEAYKMGRDMHTATAAIITGKKPENVTKEERNYGKSINFAILYGSTEFGLSYNLKISIEKGKEILDKFYEGYPVLSAFKKACERIILEKGYSKTPLGRRRYFPVENSFGDSRELAKQRARNVREGFNMIIQGGGADITKLALVNLFYGNPYGDKFRLLLQVHDEIVAEVHDSIKEEAGIWMQKVMEDAEQQFLGELPAKVDPACAKFWVH